MFEDIFKDSSEKEIMNQILGVIQSIGTFTAVGILMVLGIKYMVGSTEQRASYKRSFLPYVIGSVLIFGAVNITAVIYDGVNEATTAHESGYEEIYCTGTYEGHNCHTLVGNKMNGQITYYPDRVIVESGHVKCKTCGHYLS